MKHGLLCFASVVGGMVLGSAIALAVAPKTGEEMRKLVRDFINDEVEKWRLSGDVAHKSCECEHK